MHAPYHYRLKALTLLISKLLGGGAKAFISAHHLGHFDDLFHTDGSFHTRTVELSQKYPN